MNKASSDALFFCSSSLSFSQNGKNFSFLAETHIQF
jgi:hypothetical protein